MEKEREEEIVFEEKRIHNLCSIFNYGSHPV